MWVDQAIYTSLPRSGREGYHVVSRSRGVSETDARTLASWCPSHGALVVDEANRASVNIHPLLEGRMVVSRSCEGRPEYSGRGGKQIYTHALIFEIQSLERTGIVPISLYLDALALGLFQYRPEPDAVLEEVELGHCHRPLHLCRESRQPALISPTELRAIRESLATGKPIELHHPGDRFRFVEHFLGFLPIGLTTTISFSTSLKPSTARPFALCLIP
ncbi:GAP1-N2 domain-containing protein [Tautonia rosea]|uniref:GAP1-N2 domain-containing protein n=1 Tax=Tautonia rosea TaxID=2728037 RepID=UPI001473DD48|nr:hypothetical protein [Tautonia rosea]